ncbi:MAG: citrate synthase [Acidimicrobiaceae bacterium]|nr:citrate synthase [Acidimicrobiaceae bacterium]
MINVDAGGEDRAERIGTADVAERLGIKPETVYAYVSRGMLHSERGPRGSTFDRAEVERLARSTRRAEQSARSARELSFLTRVTRIEAGHLFYRGREAVELSRTRSFEEVAWYLWTGALVAQAPWHAPEAVLRVAREAVGALGNLGLPIDRLRVAVAAAATADPLRHDRTDAAVTLTARSLVAVMVDSLPATCPGRLAAGDRLATRLWGRLTGASPRRERLELLEAALVLIADHELAASTLAARVAASFRADPYAVVGAGLGPAGGPLHSGAAGEVRDLLSSAAEFGPERAVGRLLDRDRPLPGFGLPLYPGADPRAAELLRRLPSAGTDPDRSAVIRHVLALGERRGSPPPNVDFALGALEWGLEMVPGAGQAIFVIGRSAGWLAHAMEEYRDRSDFRVRAAYVGPR